MIPREWHCCPLPLQVQIRNCLLRSSRKRWWYVNLNNPNAALKRMCVLPICRAVQVAEWPHRENGGRVNLRTTGAFQSLHIIDWQHTNIRNFFSTHYSDGLSVWLWLHLCGALLKNSIIFCTELCHSHFKHCLSSLVVLFCSLCCMSNNTISSAVAYFNIYNSSVCDVLYKN